MTLSSFYIRPGDAADLEAVIALERATEHAPHWPRQAYEEMLQPSTGPDREFGLARCLFVAVAQPDCSQLLGFAAGSAPAAVREGCSDPAELESLAVRLHARRRGIGRALCQTVIEWARARHSPCLQLEVRASSFAVIALYRSMGFREIGLRSRYYREPEDDALLLQLPMSAGGA